MRLSKSEKEVLIDFAIEQFGAHTALYLFGSRVNDQAKGGDIDLVVIPGNKNLSSDDLYQNKIRFLVHVKTSLEDQKIDVIVSQPHDNRMIVETAIHEGIRLC
jgi:uncharacterized protein